VSPSVPPHSIAIRRVFLREVSHYPFRRVDPPRREACDLRTFPFTGLAFVSEFLGLIIRPCSPSVRVQRRDPKSQERMLRPRALPTHNCPPRRMELTITPHSLPPLTQKQLFSDEAGDFFLTSGGHLNLCHYPRVSRSFLP